MQTIRTTATTLALAAALVTGAGDGLLKDAGVPGPAATLKAQGQKPEALIENLTVGQRYSSARIAPGWGTDTMMIASRGGYARESGARLDALAGYGVRLGRQVVGTPHAGVQRSEHGRYYRAGYKVGLTGQDALKLEIRAEVQQQESRWLQNSYPAAGGNRRFLAHGNVRW